MKKIIPNDVIDWFGAEIASSAETEEEATARVTVKRSLSAPAKMLQIT